MRVPTVLVCLEVPPSWLQAQDHRLTEPFGLEKPPKIPSTVGSELKGTEQFTAKLTWEILGSR